MILLLLHLCPFHSYCCLFIQTLLTSSPFVAQYLLSLGRPFSLPFTSPSYIFTEHKSGSDLLLLKIISYYPDSLSCLSKSSVTRAPLAFFFFACLLSRRSRQEKEKIKFKRLLVPDPKLGYSKWLLLSSSSSTKTSVTITGDGAGGGGRKGPVRKQKREHRSQMLGQLTVTWLDAV